MVKFKIELLNVLFMDVSIGQLFVMDGKTWLKVGPRSAVPEGSIGGNIRRQVAGDKVVRAKRVKWV